MGAALRTDPRLRVAVAWTIDGLLAVAVGVLTSMGSSANVAGWLPRYAVVSLAITQGLLVLARRRAPFAVLAGTTALTAGMIVAGRPSGTAAIGLLVAAYAAARYGGAGEGRADGDRPGDGGERARTVRSAVATAGAMLGVTVAGVMPGSRTFDTSRTSYAGLSVAAAAASAALPVAAAWITGYAVRTRRAYIAELKDRAARLEAQEGERAARAVADERLRIARELHDVIGHAISLISIQSEAAARSARTRPGDVPGFLATISATSREAMTELRHVLSVLRPDAAADLAPQPGLRDLPELVARIQSGGPKVRLEVEPVDLPPGIGLAVYRIVQESLTNVLKHAGPDATASVTVAPVKGVLRVSVHDDGTGPSGPGSSAAHGIVGMRERVAVYGGSLTTGASGTGGFGVEAAIPLPGNGSEEES